MKKFYKIILIVFAALFIFSGHTAYLAYADDINNTTNKNVYLVNADKVWTLTFNRAVDIKTADSSIKVYETDSGTAFPVTVSQDGSYKIKVAPKGFYQEGKNYTLAVSSSLKDIYGSNLSSNFEYDFRTNDYSKSIDIKNYNDYYNAVKYALESYKTDIDLNIASYDKTTYSLDVVNKVLDDNPNLRAGYNSASSIIEYSTPVKMSMEFKYKDSTSTLAAKNADVNNKVLQIVNSVTTPSMDDYHKELALHDYVVNHARYDLRIEGSSMPYDSYTAYGVLINGTGVCQGYTDAMYRLLTAAGIENTMVIGQANNGSGWVSHTWNIVKIQGKYYNLDATWDDPVTADGSNVLLHSYFNITDAQISKDHSWDDKSKYPSCTSTDYSYKK